MIADVVVEGAIYRGRAARPADGFGLVGVLTPICTMRNTGIRAILGLLLNIVHSMNNDNKRRSRTGPGDGGVGVRGAESISP